VACAWVFVWREGVVAASAHRQREHRRLHHGSVRPRIPCLGGGDVQATSHARAWLLSSEAGETNVLLARFWYKIPNRIRTEAIDRVLYAGGCMESLTRDE